MKRLIFFRLVFILSVLIVIVLFGNYQKHKKELYLAAVEICTERGNLASECLEKGYIQKMNPDNLFEGMGSFVFVLFLLIVARILYEILKDKFSARHMD